MDMVSLTRAGGWVAEPPLLMSVSEPCMAALLPLSSAASWEDVILPFEYLAFLIYLIKVNEAVISSLDF